MLPVYIGQEYVLPHLDMGLAVLNGTHATAMAEPVV